MSTAPSDGSARVVWSPGRIIAVRTLNARIAELVDDKAGLAARALNGSDEQGLCSVDVQLEALVALLTDALAAA